MTSTTNDQNHSHKKNAKSATMNSQALGLMHDEYENNKYHSSLYRHQLHSRQQQYHCSATPTNLITSRHSCDSPCRPPPLSLTAADPARPHSTPCRYFNKYDDDPIINDSVDFNSLYEAMDDDDSHIPSHQPLPDDDDDDDVDGHDSFNTMLSFMRKNDELAQQMDEIEQLENLSFLRVMYLGVATAEEKHLFLKKLSDGVSESLFRQSPTAPPPSSSSSSSSSSTSSTPNISTTTTTPTATKTNNNNNNAPLAYGFRERKHHLLPLHLFLAGSALDNDYYDDHAAMFEDNGVFIVEADFLTDNNNNNNQIDDGGPRKHSPDLILHYIYTQYQQYYPPDKLNNILNPPPHWANQRFDGHIFSEGAPNGIDLCVYFYHDAQKMTDVTQDMDLLWKVNTLGIPILPIMSMSDQTTTPSNELADDDDDDKSLLSNDNDDDIYKKTTYVKQRPIDVRRNELAHIFSQWRIKMMDISNLDSIGQPSFQQRGNTRKSTTQQDLAIEQRLGGAWGISSMTSPTPYHVLTLFQFMAMDRWAVSKLLKTIQDRADERCCSGKSQPNDQPHSTCIHTTTIAATSTESKQQQQQSTNDDDDISSTSTTTTTTTFEHDIKAQFNDPSTQESTRRIRKEKLVTIHLWLLYALPLLMLLMFGIWMALSGIFGGIMSVWTKHQQPPTSTWYASLIMVSHSSGKSMTLMVTVYDEHHQPRWAPEPPLLWTNLDLPLIATLDGPYSRTWKESSSSPITHMAPLLNKTHPSLEGQYSYSILLPSCSLLDPDIQYAVQVNPSTTLPIIPETVQGSPLQVPRHVLCDQGQQQLLVPSYAIDGGDDLLENGQEPRHLLEAWYHFRQYSRFYFLNSLKIMELIFTEGKEKN